MNDCSSSWFVLRHEQESGPFPFQVLEQMSSTAQLGPDDWIRPSSTEDWTPADRVIRFGASSAAKRSQSKSIAVTLGDVLVKIGGVVLIVVGVLGMQAIVHFSSKSPEPSESSADSDSDDEGTFSYYYAKHSLHMSPDDAGAISFWLAEEGLMSKRMSDYPDEAESLRSQMRR